MRDRVSRRRDMEDPVTSDDDMKLRSGPTAVGCLLFLAYLVGLTIWTPFYIVWPRRYPGLTYFQSVAVRFTLVRHIWGLVTGRR